MMLFGFLPFAGLILFFLLARGIGTAVAGARNTSSRNQSAPGFGCGLPDDYDDDQPRRADTVSDSHLFRLASQSRGRLTLSDVVVNTGMTLKQAEQRMNGLADGVHVNMAVQEDGTVLYEFPELANRDTPIAIPEERTLTAAPRPRRRNGFGC